MPQCNSKPAPAVSLPPLSSVPASDNTVLQKVEARNSDIWLLFQPCLFLLQSKIWVKPALKTCWQDVLFGSKPPLCINLAVRNCSLFQIEDFPLYFNPIFSFLYVKSHYIDQRPAKFFCKRDCRFWTSCSLLTHCVTVLESSHRWYVNKWAWLCYNKTLFVKILSFLLIVTHSSIIHS